MMRAAAREAENRISKIGWGGGLVQIGWIHVSGGRVSASSVFSSSICTRRRSTIAICTAAIVALMLLLVSSSTFAAPPSEFGSRGDGAGQFASPRGLAIDQQDGDVYIGDRGTGPFPNNRVDRFGPAGEFLLAWGWGVRDGAAEPQVCGPAAMPSSATCRSGLEGSGAGEFASPEGVAVDNSPGTSQGDVYVVDKGNDRVEKFNPAGEFLFALGGEVNATTLADICLAGENCQAAAPGTGPGQFERLNGRAIAVGPDASLYVGDENRVQRFSSQGALEEQLPLPGSGFVEELAVDGAGDIYVKSSELAGVHKYEAGGIELGSPRDAGGEPGPITIGPADGLLVADSGEHVLAFDPAGAELSATSEPGELEGGLGFDQAEGLSYVVHPESVQVRALATPGKPYVVSESADELEPTTATLLATVNPEGGEETSYHFEYGTAAGVYPDSTAVTPLPLNEVQTLSVEATAGTFTLEFEGELSAPLTFDASAAELQGALEAISAIGAGNVDVGGQPGGPYAIEFTGALAARGVAELSPDPAGLEDGEEPGSASVTISRPGHTAFEDRQLSAPINSLHPATTYHYRVVAENAAHEVTQGPDQSFKTLPAVSILSASAGQITATTARLEAELNPHGLPTHYRFEYGPTTTYGLIAPIPDGDAGSGTQAVSRTVTIEGLASGTTYHYRLVAENSSGTSESEDHSFITQGPNPLGLPDGRGWELVSPPDKHGTSLEGLTKEGGLIQAAADGSKLAYIARGPITSTPAGNRSIDNSQLLATRGAEGWASTDITTPNEAVFALRPGFPNQYQEFSEDLSAGLVEPNGDTPLSPQASEKTPYLRGLDGQYIPLVNPGNVPEGTVFAGEERNPGSGSYLNEVTFAASSSDLEHIVLSSAVGLTSDFTEPTEDRSLYEWADEALQLVSILPNEEPAAKAGESAKVGFNGEVVRNAVSADGDRVIFEANEKGTSASHLYLRGLQAGQTVQLDRVQGGSGGGGTETRFQDASADGSKVFFSSEKRLAPGSQATEDRPDLYECRILVEAGHLSCSLRDLTLPTAGGSAGVLGQIFGAGRDAEHIYFVANGVLAAGARQGDCPLVTEDGTAAQSCNLYVTDTKSGETRLVARLSGLDAPDWSARSGHDLVELTGRVTPNGRYLAFMSAQSLTGYDNRDLASGEPSEEVYLYDDAGAGKLICASCNPSGARPRAAFDPGTFAGPKVDRPELWKGRYLAASVPGWTAIDNNHALYQPRYLSDAGRLFFTAADALSPLDTNSTQDVYEYESPAGPAQPASNDCSTASSTFDPAAGGCISLISSATSAEESIFLDASESGDDVFFLTAARLSPRDQDGAFDIYDARVGGGESEVSSQTACTGEGCQPSSPAPVATTPGTAAFVGPPNPKPKRKHHKHRKKHHPKHKPTKHKHAAKNRHRAPANRGGKK
jgi:hypothetical protein